MTLYFLIMADNVKAQESWNMATETLKRLSRCLDMCTYYSQMGDLPNWYNSSLSLRSNLSCFLDESEKKIIRDQFKKIPARWKTPDGRVLPKFYGIVYSVLDEIYQQCLDYMKAKGLLMPKPTDPRAAVLNN